MIASGHAAPPAVEDAQKVIDDLHRKIGQQQVERDFLAGQPDISRVLRGGRDSRDSTTPSLRKWISTSRSPPRELLRPLRKFRSFLVRSFHLRSSWNSCDDLSSHHLLKYGFDAIFGTYVRYLSRFRIINFVVISQECTYDFLRGC
jgi:hypothetical protein